MSRHDERRRVRQRLSELTSRVGASRTAGFGIRGAVEPTPSSRDGSHTRLSATEIAAAASEGELVGENDPAEGRGRPRGIALPVAHGRSEGGERARETQSPGGVQLSRKAQRVGQIGRVEGVRGGGRWDDDRLPAREMESDGSDGEPGGEHDLAGGDGEVRVPGWLAEAGSRSMWRDRIVPERFRGARFDPGWRGVVTLALVGLAAVLAATVVVLRERPVAQPVPPMPAVRTTTGVRASAQLTSAPIVATPAGAAAVLPDGPEGVTGVELVVSVVGLVHNGGLLRIPNGSRVADAITAAGGVKEGADLSGLNLAQRLQDGDQVLVGAIGPSPGPMQLGSTTISAGRTATRPAPHVGSASSSSTAARIDLNIATESDLDALPGVGPVTARAIIAWRTKNGRFTDIEQLGEIDGIGPARLARLRGLVKV